MKLYSGILRNGFGIVLVNVWLNGEIVKQDCFRVKPQDLEWVVSELNSGTSEYTMRRIYAI